MSALSSEEATFAYHTAIYGQFFKSSDCKFWASSKFLNLDYPLQEQNVNQKLLIALPQWLLLNYAKNLIKRILFPLLLMVNRIEKSWDAGEQGHDEDIAPQPFHKGATGAEVVLFHKSIIGNFMVHQDRLETYLLQLFAHPETSE